MEGASAALFGDLTAKIDGQDAQIAEAKSKIDAQNERMEEMEDMLTALAYTLKELTVAVDLREPQLTPSQLRSRSASEIVGAIGKGMPNSINEEATPVYGLQFGYLWKLGTGRVNNWKKRWFVLQNDGSATYFKTMADSTANVSQRTELSLARYTVVAANDTGKPFGFKLVSPGQRIFYLAPETETEENRKKWMDAFRAVIKTQTESNRTFKRTGSIVSIDANRLCIVESSSAPLPTGQALLDSATLSGWLELQRGPEKWTREFFAVVGSEVVQLSGSEATSVVKRLSVQASVIDVLWEDPPDDKELSFAIVKDGESVVLNAESDDQMGEWVSTLTNLAQTNA